MDNRDLALSDACHDLILLEEDCVSYYREAVAYRHLALVAVAALQEQTQRAEALERRLHQTMGVEPWHREETEP